MNNTDTVKSTTDGPHQKIQFNLKTNGIIFSYKTNKKKKTYDIHEPRKNPLYIMRKG